MSRVELADDLDETAASPAPAPPAPADPATPRKGSFLAGLQAARDADLGGAPTKVLLVGSSSQLAARYRVLLREEQEQVAARQRKLEHDVKHSRGTLTAADVAVDMASFSLALACVELVAVEGRTVRPLVDVLAEEGEDTEGTEPLRFDRRTARVLGWEHEATAKSADICEAMHDPDGSATSLMRVARRYGEWVSGAEASALEETLEGN